MLLRRILQIMAGSAFLALIVGYSIYQAQDFWAGPTIAIQSPQNGHQTSNPMLQLTGNAKRVSFLSLNGRQIFTDPNGRFEEELLLTDGYNIITVAGRDAFDRQTEEHIRVILNASSSLLFSSYNFNNEQANREQEEQEREE